MEDNFDFSEYVKSRKLVSGEKSYTLKNKKLINEEETKPLKEWGRGGNNKVDQLASNLGYDSIEEFFTDNPGADEAVSEWVNSEVPRNREWQEMLSSLDRETLEDMGLYDLELDENEEFDDEDDEDFNNLIKEEESYQIPPGIEYMAGQISDDLDYIESREDSIGFLNDLIKFCQNEIKVQEERWNEVENDGRSQEDIDWLNGEDKEAEYIPDSFKKVDETILDESDLTYSIKRLLADGGIEYDKQVEQYIQSVERDITRDETAYADWGSEEFVEDFNNWVGEKMDS
jgi:hypothetical protein